jgi:hypothetical protein
VIGGLNSKPRKYLTGKNGSRSFAIGKNDYLTNEVFEDKSFFFFEYQANDERHFAVYNKSSKELAKVGKEERGLACLLSTPVGFNSIIGKYVSTINSKNYLGVKQQIAIVKGLRPSSKVIETLSNCVEADTSSTFLFFYSHT